MSIAQIPFLKMQTKSADFTAAYGRFYNCDLSSNSIQVILPTVRQGILAIRLSAANGSNFVQIFADGGDTIEGDSDLFLYVENDLVYLQGDPDTSTWVIVHDGIQLHRAAMHQETGQTINSGSSDRLNCTHTDYDRGGLASLVNDRFTIRRSCVYHIAANWTTAGGLNLGELARLDLHISGTRVDRIVDFAGAAGSFVSPQINASYNLTAGQYVEIFISHSSGSSLLSFTNANTRPRFSISETR